MCILEQLDGIAKVIWFVDVLESVLERTSFTDKSIIVFLRAETITGPRVDMFGHRPQVSQIC
jgi:hypothetical protein